MTKHPFGHVDLRVTDLESALPFYSILMPALGFTATRQGDGWITYLCEIEAPATPFLPICEDRDHVPNKNRIAFSAATRAEVDGLALVLARAGGKLESGPRECPEYSATYYGLFFEDPCGNKLEIYHQAD